VAGQRPGQRPAPPAWKIPLFSALFGLALLVAGLALSSYQLITFGGVWIVVHLISSALFFVIARRR
jgi:hypothetical protein